MPEHWCKVNVVDPDGCRDSVDAKASSIYDAAHLFVTHAKGNSLPELPPLTLQTVF